ncbi:hypothetical protein HMPREF9533_05681, partial [Escherichia coli MS 60-1]
KKKKKNNKKKKTNPPGREGGGGGIHGDNICLKLFRMQVSSDNHTSRILFLIVE